MHESMLSLATLLVLVACGSATVEGDDDDDGTGDPSGLDPDGDEDGDGYTNGDEEAMGSDPYDAGDVPYTGGWAKDDHCNDDIVSTGNEVGEVAEDFALLDQYGDEWHLHDFCDHVVLVYFSGFT